MTFKSNRRYATFEQDRSEFREYCKEIKAENRRLLEADSQSEEEEKGISVIEDSCRSASLTSFMRSVGKQ